MEPVTQAQILDKVVCNSECAYASEKCMKNLLTLSYTLIVG